MSRQGSPEHRALQSAVMRAWFANPENAAAHAERQRKRFASPEGQAHLRKIGEAARVARRAARVIPEHFEPWNSAMREAGIPRAERLAAIAKAQQDETRHG